MNVVISRRSSLSIERPIRRLLISTFHSSGSPPRLLLSSIPSCVHQYGNDCVSHDDHPDQFPWQRWHHFHGRQTFLRPCRRTNSCYFSTESYSNNQKNNNDDDQSNKPAPNKSHDTKTSNVIAEVQAVLPGVALATVTCLTGFSLASAITSVTDVSLSGIPVAIVLGIVLRTTTNTSSGLLRTRCQPGLTVAAKSILQFGIVCVGIKLSVWQLATASTTSVPVVLAAITAGMVGIPRIATLLGMMQQSSYTTSTTSTSTCLVPLLTAGTSICGVTAISALAPAIQAPPQDVAVAVANTVAFGTIGMLTYPYILHTLVGYNSTVVGLTLGVAIHDTSQVMGAALSYKETYGDEMALELAAVTKLVRNLGLAAAIPYLTYQHQRNHPPPTSSAEGSSPPQSLPIRQETISGLTTFTKIVPPFLVAFLSMSVLRSIGDIAIMTSSATGNDATAMASSVAQLYEATVSFIGNDVSKYALGTAMAATGLSIDANSLRTVGWRPFALGGASAILVGGVGCGTSFAVSYASSIWAHSVII